MQGALNLFTQKHYLMKAMIAGKALDIEAGLVSNRTPREVEYDVKAFLKGQKKDFKDYRFNLSSFTTFQQRVFKEMVGIPFGENVSYKELAKRVGRPKAFRAVANACGANPLPIIIPCHRVIASNGLGGYSSGIGIKKHLLRLEGSL